jgi:hypothetical protein
MVQLVEALSHMSEGSRFDSCWGYQDFSSTSSLQLHYTYINSPGVNSVSNRNEYHGSPGW